PIVDVETGEIIAEAGQVVDRRTLNKLLPYLEGEKAVGIKEYPLRGGAVEGTCRLQTIKIFSPEQEGKVINVISNAVVDPSVKYITPADIVAAVNYRSEERRVGKVASRSRRSWHYTGVYC